MHFIIILLTFSIAYVLSLLGENCIWSLLGLKAWFPYYRPDRPSRLKKCLNDRGDHMETLPRRS